MNLMARIDGPYKFKDFVVAIDLQILSNVNSTCGKFHSLNVLKGFSLDMMK